ncbi:MAG TPA: NACHT domain-containing protein, partial [Thermoleophilaceae bacterium]
ASNNALGLRELVDAASTDVFERRRLRRQFEQVADRIAAQLAPFLEAEFAGIPENEVAAATRLAEEVLASTEISAETLAAVDADPRSIEADARRSSRERIEHAYLSDSAEAMFDLLLKETTDYVVDLAVGLPPFNSAAAQEMLRRETLIIARIDEVLQRLPQTPKFLGGLAAGASEAFETEFRRVVSRNFDQLELFGLDLEEYRRYTLSIAYITLSVERSRPAKPAERRVLDEDKAHEGANFDAGPADEGGYLTAVQALDEMPRALVTGDAGSGKTTLLQWLAVQACKGELENDLPSWGNLIPFFIPLRRSVDAPLPPPEDFVKASAPQLAGAMPPGWVHDQLGSGRGLVLVDGVDELPPPQRDDVRRWLDELVTTFPDSRFVVTSRPPAVEEGWLEPQAFGKAELQPMSFTDIASFVQHWHDASLNGTEDDEELERVADLSQRLQELIRTDGAVRSLATSPLLCAMLCALHRDRKAQLPRGRLEVYRVALESLVERRDAEREVPHGLPAQSLSLPEKMVLLRDLSCWLLVNGYSDAPKDRCVERVESKLASMPHLDYSGEEIFDYLLTRSGVLREPVSGRIDFLHRTFQEYLAAGEIIEQDNVGQLISFADSDEWSVVVVLAAGQGRRPQREELIRGLIERAKTAPQVSHRLRLLAVACLDTSVELSPELSAELEAILRQLIPPRTLTEANALASAGELAVPLLAARWQRQDARTTAGCVRSLGLIGGELAITTLAALAADHRVTVGRE